jgi:hypothetical protein
METSLRIKVSELDMGIIENIKRLFGADKEVMLTIESSTDFGLNTTETKEQYFQRLENAIENLEKGKKVTLTEQEMDEMVLQQLKK